MANDTTEISAVHAGEQQAHREGYLPAGRNCGSSAT